MAINITSSGWPQGGLFPCGPQGTSLCDEPTWYLIFPYCSASCMPHQHLQWVHIIGPPSHWSPVSLVPHLIGPPSHWFPISVVPQLAPRHHPFHWSPISLVPPTHWSPISLVPHLIGPLLIGPPIHKSPTTLFELIGPPSHWSPFSLVHAFSANPNGPPSHWPPITLVPHLIGPPSHWSPSHWSSNS